MSGSCLFVTTPVRKNLLKIRNFINFQGCILFRIPYPREGGEFFQVIWEDFQVVQVGKEEKGRERRKGDEKTKREKKKGRKRDKRG